MVVTANEIKTKGVSLFDKLFQKVDEVVINIRGKSKYVVIDIERYKKMRELELDRAYQESMKNIENGKYTTDLDKHLEDIKKSLNEL